MMQAVEAEMRIHSFGSTRQPANTSNDASKKD